ncbi:MAG: molybdate ABC transporter substrate-binding protein [Epsilonproteobacteria bacterium]|nr:molybdate ABC transporter substrate-binding protein [Campylobacterota bacterium]
MKLKPLLLILLLPFFSMAETIKVAVAANVSYAIDDLKKEFNKLYPDTKVQVTLGSTGKLTAQIKNGAPYQILMGANMMYPEKLYSEDYAVTRPLVYAQGSLAYLSSKKRDFSKGIALLKSDKIKKIAIANPKTAPYGIATAQALKNAKIYDEVKSKFVFAESISQTVTYAVKATDLGFIAKSSLYTPQMAHFKEGENWAELDPKLYTPINQGIVILKEGETSAEVSAFYAFIFSKKAEKIFKEFGYIIP